MSDLFFTVIVYLWGVAVGWYARSDKGDARTPNTPREAQR